MDEKEIDLVWLNLYKIPHYLMPFATGDYMVYHHESNHYLNQGQHYQVICPRRFAIKFFYEDNMVEFAKDVQFKPRAFVEFPMTFKLEDYFEIKNWRGRDIPIALKRFALEYRVERLKNLLVFT